MRPAPLTSVSVSQRRSARERIKERPNLLHRLLPLPWQLWPSEARLLIGLTVLWSLAGLIILGSSSWWVALREIGDGIGRPVVQRDTFYGRVSSAPRVPLMVE